MFAGRRIERPYSSSRSGEDDVDARAPPRQCQRAPGHRQRALREKLSAFRRVQRRQCADARDGVDLGPLSVANSCSRERFAGPLETPASKPPLKLQGPQTNVHSIGPTHVTKKPRPILRAPPEAMLEPLGRRSKAAALSRFMTWSKRLKLINTKVDGFGARRVVQGVDSYSVLALKSPT